MTGSHPDLGAPIAYLVLEPGVPVLASGQEEVGHVARVLSVPENDIFDGLILETPDGERFVDAANVDALYERGVVLALSTEDARDLPEPTPGPGAISVDPDDLSGGGGNRATDAIRRAWDLISGKY